MFALATELHTTLHALYTEYFVRAAERLIHEVPDSASPGEVMQAFQKFHREEMEKAGARWPKNLTQQEVSEAGGTWHIFPNAIVLASYDGAMWYRARPYGNDPDACIFDVWWLGRYAPGKEPAFQHDIYPTPAAFAGQNPFLEQDFSSMQQVQKGMHSRGFSGARTNPNQEAAISNLHKHVYAYLFDEDNERSDV